MATSQEVISLPPLDSAGRCTQDGLVHSTAILASTACIGENVRIEAYVVVEEGVVVGCDSVLRAHCVLRRGTVVGRSVRIDSFAVIGGDPQDQSFDMAIESGVRLGDRVVAREGVTVNRSAKARGVTFIGDDVLLMANSHVGHDSQIGEHAVLANNVMLGGHVEVGAHAFLGGGVGVHQHVRVGEGSMIGGNASIAYDVAPFTLASERNRIHGLNVVGLRRRQVAGPVIADLKRCYRAAFSGSGDPRRKAAAALTSGECGRTDLGRRLLEFFAAGVRGVARPC